jgi:hypothetical protein
MSMGCLELPASSQTETCNPAYACGRCGCEGVRLWREVASFGTDSELVCIAHFSRFMQKYHIKKLDPCLMTEGTLFVPAVPLPHVGDDGRAAFAVWPCVEWRRWYEMKPYLHDALLDELDDGESPAVGLPT